ncbi:MAG: hypothetical protein OXE94_04540 [Aestuariivita sp.]|nr:hypothetical protein [Aestuariivita sp.]
MSLLSGLTARESEEAWRQFGVQGPSTASLLRLTADVGSEMATGADELLSAVRDREALPTGTASLLVSLDGVMMRMNTETVGETATDAGWRAAAGGVIGFVDADGNLLDARCFGQLPEAGKETLKSQLSAELFHWLTVDPDLKVVAVADGAPDNWTFLEALCPDLALLDFWPAAEHLKAAARVRLLMPGVIGCAKARGVPSSVANSDTFVRTAIEWMTPTRQQRGLLSGRVR